MKLFNQSIAGILMVLSICISCHKKKEYVVIPPTYYTNVPDGGTAVIDNQDLSNQGLLVNRANTTWVIQGNVTMDDLSVVGKVVIAQGAVVTVKGLVNVAGGAKLEVDGSLSCTTLTQVGNAFYNNGRIIVNGQYTISGGTNTYLQNSRITVNDLRILGSIYGLENDAAKQGTFYSVFYFPVNNTLYLNRASGNQVCGPVLFTYNDDKGTSGVALKDVSSTVLNYKPSIKDNYALPVNTVFYQYAEQACTPVSTAAGF